MYIAILHIIYTMCWHYDVGDLPCIENIGCTIVSGVPSSFKSASLNICIHMYFVHIIIIIIDKLEYINGVRHRMTRYLYACYVDMAI